MKTIYFEKIQRILKNKKRLEEELNVKITNRGKEIFIEGVPEDEYIAEKAIDALNMGFPLKVALLIKNEDFVFEVLNIKDYTKRHDLKRIRARIIGTGGKTLRTLCNLTKCFFEIKNNDVGIIGHNEYIEIAQEGIFSIIKGTKQANVYAYLEKHQPEPIVDLGLKEPKKRKRTKER